MLVMWQIQDRDRKILGIWGENNEVGDLRKGRGKKWRERTDIALE